ncbi:MAG TPA: carboxypeptidase-like regulatory domain-containing protein, partial [Tepidisphaeraceae bacterium]|nr:carboxypeptidase-like regulatory domain-containing protein [Tepidisphaeraceae bacterium]
MILACAPCLWAADAKPALPTLDEVVAKLDHANLSGKVIDKDGKPVEGADVFLCYTRMDQGPRDRLVAQVKSAPDGSFRFDKAIVWEPQQQNTQRYNQQRYHVVARHPEQGLEFATILEKDPTDNVVVQLQETRNWRVTVVDPKGNPIEGAKVFLMRGYHSSNIEKNLDREHQYLTLTGDFGISTAMTDAKGEVNLLGTPREAFFGVEKDGYAQGWYRDKITLYPSAKVSGRVTYQDGSPAAGVAVWFEYHGDRLIANDSTLTDDQGRYEFRNTPASGYRFGYMQGNEEKDAKGVASVKAGDLRPGSPYLGKKVSFPIQSGEVHTKDLTLIKSVTFAGKVIDITTNQPAPNVRVQAYASTEGSRYLDTIPVKVDAQGNFSASVAPGTRVMFQWERSESADYIIDEDWQSQG